MEVTLLTSVCGDCHALVDVNIGHPWEEGLRVNEEDDPKLRRCPGCGEKILLSGQSSGRVRKAARGWRRAIWSATGTKGKALFDCQIRLKKCTESALIPLSMEENRSQYTISPLSGLGKASRAQLAAVLRKSGGVVTPVLAVEALSVSRVEAAKLLSRWAAQGWLQRVRRGIYVPVPLESERADSAPEDAWPIADTAFAPCFISGWSAAEYWGLTEQVFRTVLVSTTRRLRSRNPRMGRIDFRLRTVNEKEFFGLKAVWRGRTRVQVSDPSRTIVDLMSDPSLGGGLRSSADMLQNYLASKEHRNLGQLVSYAETLGVGAVFKRLGYLLERFAPDERNAIGRCARALTKGNAKLDPALPNKKLVTAWRLWLPEGWKVP